MSTERVEDRIETDGVLSKPFRWLSIGMYALILIAAFESLAVTTVMPVIARELHGQSLYALSFAVPFAAGVVGMVIAGNWTDRAGPLRSLLAAAALFVVGIAVAGTATTMLQFILGRLVYGIGGAAVIVPLYVIVARVYPEGLRPRVFAGFAAAWVIPSIVGPTVAGLIAERLSWHWVFLGVGLLVLPAGAMMLAPILRVRDEVGGDPAVSWSLARIAWSALAAFAALGVSMAKDLPEPWRWPVALVAIAVVVVAVRPLLPAGALHAVRGMPATVLMRAVVAAAFFGSEIYLPYLLVDRYGLSPSLAGVVLTGAGVSWALASWIQGRLGDRVSNSGAVRIGSAGLLVALLIVLALAAFSLPAWVAFLAWTVSGGAMGFMYPRFAVSVLELSPQQAQGFNSAALSIGESLASATALAITALVAANATALGGDPFTASLAVTVAVAVVGVVLAPRVRPRHP